MSNQSFVGNEKALMIFVEEICHILFPPVVLFSSNCWGL